MNPEFEDENLRRWRATDADAVHTDDPSVLEIDVEREEIYESRAYGLGPQSVANVMVPAFANDIPAAAAVEYSQDLPSRKRKIIRSLSRPTKEPRVPSERVQRQIEEAELRVQCSTIWNPRLGIRKHERWPEEGVFLYRPVSLRHIFLTDLERQR